MTVDQGTGHARTSTRPLPGHTWLARWAVWLARAAAGAAVAATALFGLAVAIGGTEGTEDNWVGILLISLVLAAWWAALTAFVLAVLATARYDRWRLLWLPLSLFPTLVAVLALGEALWWE